MQKLTRLLIVYTAVAVTILLIITLTTLRDAAEKSKKTESSINSLKEELGKITAYQESSKEIVQKLDSLKSEMAASADKEVLGEKNQAQDSSKVTSGFVTINDKKWQTVDIYESSSYSSKVIGKMEFDKIYPFLKKDGGWYQITLPQSETKGWVAGRFLKEIEDNGPKQ